MIYQITIAKFPAAPNRAQTYKLKNQATPRRAIQPKLITFGEYGKVKWFTCLKSQDDDYRKHAENMKQLQLARKVIFEWVTRLESQDGDDRTHAEEINRETKLYEAFAKWKDYARMKRMQLFQNIFKSRQDAHHRVPINREQELHGAFVKWKSYTRMKRQ